MKTILTLIQEQLTKIPDIVAVLFKETKVTYKELDLLSNQFAGYLKEVYGTESGYIAGVKLEKNAWLLVAILGVWKSGGACVFIALDTPKDRLDYIKNDSSYTLIDVKVIREFQENKDRYDTEVIAPELSLKDPAYISYTLGSTGKAKKIPTRHDTFMNFLYAMDHGLELDNTNDSSLKSISFDMFIVTLFWKLSRGIQIVFEEYTVSDRDTNDVQMKFSLFYFGSQNETLENPNYKFLLDSAKYADENGFHAIWLPERHFHEFGGVYPSPSVLGGAIASVTNTIGINSGSVVLPLHDTIRVAEEWAVVDKLSNGRISLSIASGWHVNDFVLKPYHYKDRYSVMYNQVEELKKLWEGGHISRKNGLGKDISLKVFPQPIQKSLPIWITSGGNQETMKSAGKIGANLLTHLLGQDIDSLRENIKIYKEALLLNGHSVNDAKITLMLHTFIDTDIEKAKKVVEKPFKNYLRSSLGLLKNLNSGGIDPNEMDEEALDSLLNVAFKRYWKTSALFGSKESCSKLIENLCDIGITEIGCLIDFGIDEKKVLEGLVHLNSLKDRYTENPIQIENTTNHQLSSYS